MNLSYALISHRRISLNYDVAAEVNRVAEKCTAALEGIATTPYVSEGYLLSSWGGHSIQFCWRIKNNGIVCRSI